MDYIENFNDKIHHKQLHVRIHPLFESNTVNSSLPEKPKGQTGSTLPQKLHMSPLPITL